MEKFSSDLHFHTTDSDGTRTNAERIEEILALDPKKEGIWATTNHDRFSPGFVEGARDAGIQAIWATEISTHCTELDLSFHITCYAPYLSSRIASIIDIVILKRKDKIKGQIEKLQKRGFQITEEDFIQWIISMKMSPENANNWHLAQYLWKQKSTPTVVLDVTDGRVNSELDFMRECLRENGDFSEIGYHEIPRYEPELSDLVEIAKQEDIILSVAHPNFSFTKKLIQDYSAINSTERIQAFQDHIVPILSDVGIENYEVNALASLDWKETIMRTIKNTGGFITFGSDNHGLNHADSKHGVFGYVNPFLTEEDIESTLGKLHSFV